MPTAGQGRGVLLGIECSTPAGGVALADKDGRLLAQTWRETSQPVSGRLLGDIEALLQGSDLTRESIGAVAVTLGPGAFTGIRVGLAVAKAVAHGMGVPLFCYSTLEAAARRTGRQDVAVGVLFDARRAEVYSGIYRFSNRDDEPVEVLREARAEPISRFLEDVADADWHPLRLTGNGVDLYRNEIEAALGGDRAVRIVPSPLNRPGADVVALLGARDWSAGRTATDPLAVAPIYLRVSDAEKRHRVTASIEWTAR